MELEGRVVQTWQGPSAVEVHTPRYCPTGQADVLPATHVWPLR